MNEIFVTNNNDFDHIDAYNGREFVFPKGEKVLVPVDAAIHMFGVGLVDKTEKLIRLGWANLPNEAGVDRLKKFVFTKPVMVEAPVEEAPAEEAAQ